MLHYMKTSTRGGKRNNYIVKSIYKWIITFLRRKVIFNKIVLDSFKDKYFPHMRAVLFKPLMHTVHSNQTWPSWYYRLQWAHSEFEGNVNGKESCLQTSRSPSLCDHWNVKQLVNILTCKHYHHWFFGQLYVLEVFL